MNFLNRLQLKDKLLVLGVLPAAILAIILAVYFTNSRLTEVQELFKEKEINLAVALSNSSVYGVFSGDTDSLLNTIQSFVQNNDVLVVTISDAQQRQIIQVQRKQANLKDKDFVITKRPIIINPINDSDEMGELFIQQDVNNNDNIIGYVTVQSSLKNINQRQKSILLNSVYITFFTLVIIALIAYNIGKTIGTPILNLADDVIKVKKGQYNLPVHEFTSQDEISALSHGIRDMAHELETNQLRQQQKIREATQELKKQNQQLNLAQKSILKAAEAKSKFVSHISHEIRTPLNGIIGFLGFIEQTPLTSEQKKLVNASMISSQNLHQIINDVLDLAQLEAGKIKVNKKDLNLKILVENTLSTLDILSAENNVIINFEHDDNLPTHIHQDPTKLGQILLNLVSNAIKFSPNSTVTVKLSAHKNLKHHLSCQVIDHGVGISEKNLSDLFKEFTQFESSSYERGSGLGLSITQKIIDALNGQITVKSKLGEGSTFQFSIPFSVAQQSVSEHAKKPLDSLWDTAYLGLSGINILAADDNEINRQLLTHLLEKHNANITCVNDGQQAYDATQQKKYDLLLLDLRMPFKMGHEVLQEIRSNPAQLNHDTPAIAITAHVTSGVERAHHINNFDGYLVKPIDHAELLHLICQLFNDINYAQHIKKISSKRNKKANSELKTFDLQHALSSMGNNHELVKSMLSKFLNDLPNQLESIKHELAHNAPLAAADVVHNIHGSAAYCGTTCLKRYAKNLEECLRNEPDSSSIKPLIKSFFTEAEALISTQHELINSIKKAPNNGANKRIN